jgi:hypothetical protein
MAVVVEQGLIQGIIGKLFKTYDHYERTKEETTIYKIFHRKLKIEQD